MKRQFLLLFAIAVFATALTTNASGQTAKTVRTNVTFDFRIGDRIYPAGEYRIELVSAQSDNLLLIRNVGDANKTQIIWASNSNTGKRQTPKLVFLKEGDSYFLTEIFLDSGQLGYSIPPSRRQREREKNLASRIPRNK
jgi:hypothetical protein